MALPKLTTPVYELVIPSNDEKIKYRPFLVKEEKLLLIAMESGKQEEVVEAVRGIVEECTYNKLNLGSLPMFDVEYIFLNIRAKSVGEISEVRMLCPDDNETYANAEVNLSEVVVQVEEGHTNKIELTDEMGMYMTYPTINSFVATGITEVSASNMLSIIASCIAQIYDKKGEEVFDAKDQTKEELIEFVEQLNTTQFRELQNFFDTMPKLKHEIIVKNPKTGVENNMVLQGLSDFFG
jgi:hypothetical protein|tara:strand:- start:616 stop:1329 length:714 start_codon:yes stop_codon:yes gene_type:complete